jgi:hypothetical protein
MRKTPLADPPTDSILPHGLSQVYCTRLAPGWEYTTSEGRIFPLSYPRFPDSGVIRVRNPWKLQFSE